MSGVQIQPPKGDQGDLGFSWRIVNRSGTEFQFDGYVSKAYDSTNGAMGISGNINCGAGASEVRIKAGSELSSASPACYTYFSSDGRKPATIEFGFDPAIIVELN